MKRVREFFRKYEWWIAAGVVVALGWMGYLRFGRGIGWAPGTGFVGKTLWDLLELLIVPVFIAVGAWWLDRRQKKTEREFEQARLKKDREIARERREQDLKIAKERREQDLRIAGEKRQDATLEAYFDRMTALLLEEGLRDSEVGDEGRTIARTRTRVVLRRLDGKRNGHIIRFLVEAGLLSADDPIVSLSGINLQGANLEGIDLSGVSLQEANLRVAKLQGIKLIKADLQWSKFWKAILWESDLREARLRGADFREAELHKVDLRETKLKDAHFYKAKLLRANLRGADLRNAILWEAELCGSDLWEANLSGVDLWMVDLRGAQNLDEASFEGAKLNGAKVLARDVEALKRAGADLSSVEVVEK
jgi:uncharacterized protein YjbI with pentapeptide repeats